MKKLLIIANAIGVLVMTGCVSVESLDRDLKSGDLKKQSTAQQNLPKIVTNGKIGFTTFSTEDRLWCAKHITDKAEIAKVIETMACVRRDSQAPEEVNKALEGMCCDVNAPIVEVLLANLGLNESVVERLARGDICYAPGVYKVVLKYVEESVKKISDTDFLYGMVRKCANWRSLGGGGGETYELPMTLHERILPERIIELVASIDDVRKFLSVYNGFAFKELSKAVVAKIESQKDLAELLKDCADDRDLCGLIVERISDQEILQELAVQENNATWQYKGSSVGERALANISDKGTLVRIALLAKNEVVSRQAEKKIGDTKAVVAGLVELVNNKEISEENVESYVNRLSDDEATIALYDAVSGNVLKKLIFNKLSADDRKAVRERDIAKCRQMIESAKSKSSETFEMGGFYLGMDLADADTLIGYYFPEWSTKESVDSDEKDIRVLYVPQQERPLCRAGKDGKVWQFNFGKSILKKFFKYDVQNESEWARAYSKEYHIDMKRVFINKDTTVADVSGSFDVTTYKAWLSQDTWQWKDNAKGYRLIYFAEPQIETAHGNIVKRQAAYQFRFVSADAGTLRVTVEND